MEIKKLNLGCGEDIKEGYVNIDYKEMDLNIFPYNFKDNQFEEVLMFNILEHLIDPYKVMLEVSRISKEGARIHIKIPHFSSDDCWGDIQHKRGFSTKTFTHNNMSMFEMQSQRIKFSRYGFFIEPFANIFPWTYERFFAYLFQAKYLDIVLINKKESEK